MSVELTKQQGLAVQMAKEIAKSSGGGPAIGILGGYAGTGKTTTLETITQELGCVLLAPTGKAATRISQITGLGASTIHRWMYDVEVDEKSGIMKFYRKKPDEIAVPRDNLLVIDEASMLSREVWQDVLDTCSLLRINILLIGDAFQLPPISKDLKDKFSVFNNDFACTQKVMLTEILRQAAESPIIRISQNIRDNDLAEAFDELNILESQDSFDHHLRDTVQNNGMLITFTNEMRHHLNNYYRHKAKLTELSIGEPLLVLKNNYQLDIFNGETFTFTGKIENLGKKPVFCHVAKDEKDTHFFTTKVYGQDVILGEEVIDGLREKFSVAAMERATGYWTRAWGTTYLHCNYGYALTCHKAQGHQADKVLIAMQPQVRTWTEDGRRWLYTAITRAQNEVVLYHVDKVTDLPIGLTEQ